jgi:dTDP-4-amino-4,6-dideoxygalactose transaminase
MTLELSQLALFGGPPRFSSPLHVGKPNIGSRNNLFKRLEDILDRRWLSNNGIYIQEFEQKVAEISGTKHCIATCNGTIALEIAIRAAGLIGEVIVPSFTFIATAHALQWQGITPIFADIDPVNHLIAPDAIHRLITPRTSAILGVHVWGQGCNFAALSQIANDYHIPLIFDAAHAFGCTYQNKPIGQFGLASILSFHATKFVNSLEGGAIVTNDSSLAEKARLMTNFGFKGYDHVGYIGTNGKMNEFSAAMGLSSLESIDEFIAANHANYQQYSQGLEGLKGIEMLTYDEKEKQNYQYIILNVDPSQSPLKRDELVDLLWTENVRARRYFYPGCHRMEPYCSDYPNAGLLLPNTELASQQIVVLPTGQTLSAPDITKICQIIRLGIDSSEAVSGALKTTVLPKHPRRPDEFAA